MIDLIGWCGTFLVLACYFLSQYYGMKLFNIANIILCIPVALPAIVRGAYSSAAISIAFGLIAIYHEAHNE